MAKKVLKNVGVKLNSTDISAQVSQVTLNYSANTEETTAMGNNSVTRLASLKDFSVELQVWNDFSASEIDSILFPLIGADSKEIKILIEKGTAVGTNNPMFIGNAIVQSYPPLGPEVGSAAAASVTLQGDGDLTRNTSGIF